MDFRRSPPALPPLTILNSTVLAVESFRFLGSTISRNLKWEPNINTIIKNHQEGPAVTFLGTDKLEPKSTTTDTVCSRSSFTSYSKNRVKTRKSVRCTNNPTRSRQSIHNPKDRQAGSEPGDQSIQQTNPTRSRQGIRNPRYRQTVKTQGSQVTVTEQTRDSLAKTHKTIWQRTSESGQV